MKIFLVCFWSGLRSGSTPEQKVSWSVEYTLQNTPNFLARAVPENTSVNARVSNYLWLNLGLWFSILKITLIRNIPEDYVADVFFMKPHRKIKFFKVFWLVVMAVAGLFGTTSGGYIFCFLLLYITLLFVFLITGTHFFQNKQENQEIEDNFTKAKKEK